MAAHALNPSNAAPGNVREDLQGSLPVWPRPVGKLHSVNEPMSKPKPGPTCQVITCVESISHQKNWDTIISQIYFVDFKMCCLFVWWEEDAVVVLETWYCFAFILLAVFGLVWFYFQCPIYTVNVDYGGVFTFKVTVAQEKARKTYTILNNSEFFIFIAANVVSWNVYYIYNKNLGKNEIQQEN